MKDEMTPEEMAQIDSCDGRKRDEIADKIIEIARGEDTDDVFDACLTVIACGIVQYYSDSDQQVALDAAIEALRVHMEEERMIARKDEGLRQDYREEVVMPNTETEDTFKLSATMGSIEIANKIGKSIEGENISDVFDALVALILCGIVEHYPDSNHQMSLQRCGEITPKQNKSTAKQWRKIEP
jgi:hypothetical protein